MVFCFVQNLFFGQHESQDFFFFSPEFNIRLYDENSESDYFFSLHQNQNIFLEKKHNPSAPLQVKWSFPKASSPDIISHKMLQVSPEKIAVPLRIIFNKSLEQCKYHKSWKKANVIPIFKKDNNSYPSNYRPISLIICVGKVMERVVYKHVYNHL